MKRYVTLGAALCLAAGVAGCSGEDPAPPAANPFPPLPVGVTYFDVTDEAGRWFDSGVEIGKTRSLAVVQAGAKVKFLQTRSINGPSRVESFHTVTSLIWPAGAAATERLDQDKANRDDHEVTLNTKGLYVFVCKVHPYMLAGVIVDDPTTTDPNSTPPGRAALDIGEKIHLLGVTHTASVKDAADDTKALDSLSDIGKRLLRAFFVVTSPANWKDYRNAGQNYVPTYPDVSVSLTGGAVAGLRAALAPYDGKNIDQPTAPTTPGIGEVWVDTQYEESAGKGPAYPSTITVVDAATWKVKRKIALPNQKMNNGHNMWASHDQNEIYQTEWHGKSLFVINRADGSLKQELSDLGQDPAHVMTRVNNGQVHVGLNGEDAVAEMDRNANGTLTFKRRILVQLPTEPQAQPHAHWMGFDGQSMVTPNSNTGDSTLFDFGLDKILTKNKTGPLPIAAAMDPRSIRYYVSNYLGHSVSVMCGPAGAPLTCDGKQPGQKITDIPLLLNGNYDPVGGGITGPIGGLPIQTPVSPDGKFVITGNTLTATITIIDTDANGGKGALVAMVPCDPGCHGVNFGAKPGGGYYAYVTSKFSNRLIVLDYDADNDGTVTPTGQDAPVIAGSVLLVEDTNTVKDDTITGNRGMGGQGVLPVPNVYNGWVQALPADSSFCTALNAAQKDPFPTEAPATLCP